MSGHLACLPPIIGFLDLPAVTATRQPIAFPSTPRPVSPAPSELCLHARTLQIASSVFHGHCIFGPSGLSRTSFQRHICPFLIRSIELPAATAARKPTAFPTTPGPVSPASSELCLHTLWCYVRGYMFRTALSIQLIVVYGSHGANSSLHASRVMCLPPCDPLS